MMTQAPLTTRDLDHLQAAADFWIKRRRNDYADRPKMLAVAELAYAKRCEMINRAREDVTEDDMEWTD